MVALHARQNRGVCPVPQFALHQHHDVGGGRLCTPLCGMASHVDQHGSALQFRQRLAHLRVPAKPADIIHNLGSGLHRGTSDAGLVGIDRDQRLRPLLLERSNDRDHPVQFFFFSDRGMGRRFVLGCRVRPLPRLVEGRAHLRPWPCGFTAHIDDVSPVL